MLGLAVVGVLSVESAASAEDSAYCHEVHARAVADAALLMSPQLLAQAIRFPSGGGADLTSRISASGTSLYQARVGMIFSPLDFYKGLGTIDVADADCEQHEAQVGIEELLLQADDAGRLPALRKQAAYLDAHRSDWQTASKKDEDRFAARVITLIEVGETRTRTVELERKVVQVHGEAEKLEARGFERPRASLGTMANAYLARSDRFEREVAHLRSLGAWQLKVTGGLVPTDQPLDWFGIAELTFNLGAFVHNHQNGNYIEARAEELKHAHYEIDARLHEFQKQLEGARAQARHELEIVDRQLSTITTTRHALEGSDAPNVAHAVALLTLEEISVGSEQTYLRSLVDELSSFLMEKNHGS